MFSTYNSELTAEQLSAAQEFFSDYAGDVARSHSTDNFVDYEKTTELRQRGTQLFGVFGSTSYELHVGKFHHNDILVEWSPLLVDGALIHESPEEGNSGIAHLIRIMNPRRKPSTYVWRAQFLPCGWLHTAELDQSNAEIRQHIADEVADGETPLTGRGLPGWA